MASSILARIGKDSRASEVIINGTVDPTGTHCPCCLGVIERDVRYVSMPVESYHCCDHCGQRWRVRPKVETEPAMLMLKPGERANVPEIHTDSAGGECGFCNGEIKPTGDYADGTRREACSHCGQRWHVVSADDWNYAVPLQPDERDFIAELLRKNKASMTGFNENECLMRTVMIDRLLDKLHYDRPNEPVPAEPVAEEAPTYPNFGSF